MKKAVFASPILAALVAASPVAAQDWNNGRGDWNGYHRDAGYDRGYGDQYCDGQRARDLDGRIDAEASRGSIDPRSASNVRYWLNHTEGLERRYCAGGLNGREARDLDTRYAKVNWLLKYAVRESGDGYRSNYPRYRR